MVRGPAPGSVTARGPSPPRGGAGSAEGRTRGEVEARGWTFPPDAVFDPARLVALLATFPGVTRAKGVFHTPHDWLAVNRAGGAAPTVNPTAYRRDSRVQVFADPPDWERFERELRACLLPEK